jgi:hypothetical protein
MRRLCDLRRDCVISISPVPNFRVSAQSIEAATLNLALLGAAPDWGCGR